MSTDRAVKIRGSSLSKKLMPQDEMVRFGVDRPHIR